MFFSIILMVLILTIFRKQRIEDTKEGSKTEMLFCLSWYALYVILAMISNAFQIDIINEITNWLFLFLFPLLIIAGLRKGKLTEMLREMGFKRVDKETGVRILLVCMLYTGVLLLVFSLGEETQDLIPGIPKMLAKFPIYFCLMLLTAGFTEEVFFRGIVQRCMLNTWKRPYIAILSASVLFGLYHFPFAYYLWDSTAGSIVDSIRAVLMEQAVTGCALGLMYYKSNKNIWSSVILHAFINASIMSLSVVLAVD